MPIPDYQSFMLPLLQLASDGKDHSIRDAVSSLSAGFLLNEADRHALLPSGTQTIVYNRVGWARTYLCKAGLLEIPKRSYFRITIAGKDLLTKKLEKITVKVLNQFEAFVAFRAAGKQKADEPLQPPEDDIPDTPEEAIEHLHQTINDKLSDEILATILTCSPAFFEKLVLDLLLRVGYGGSVKDAGEVVGKVGDEGIDVLIKEDKLGLDVIYVQAKRWKGPVGRPEIHKFAGALLGKKARKGIFISTSTYSQDAIEYVNGIENKIILIDGKRLASLMIETNVGVSVDSIYEIKRIDTDYFEDDR
jgi:restriction system protein